MSLFGIEIKPNLVFHQPALPYTLRLTLATLGHDEQDLPLIAGVSSRTTLMFKTQGLQTALPLCSLTPEKMDQQPLDLLLDVGQEVEFYVKGPNAITLLGNFLPDEEEDEDYDDEDYEDYEEDDDEEEEDEDDDIIIYRSMDLDDDSDQEKDQRLDTRTKIVEINDQEIPALVPTPESQLTTSSDTSFEDIKSRVAPMELDQEQVFHDHSTPMRPLKKKKEDIEATPRPTQSTLSNETDKTPKPKPTKQPSKPLEPTATTSSTTKKKQAAKKSKKNPSKLTEVSTPTTDSGTTPKRPSSTTDESMSMAMNDVSSSTSTSPPTKKLKPTLYSHTYPSGLVVKDLSSPSSSQVEKAKPGQFLSVRYIGRIHKTGKVFDMNMKGPPFKFRLGQGEVISGWDQGFTGLAVNQRRQLIVPPKLAYGKRGAPPEIPPNATLEFEVKLLSISK
ncbi:hypothetical protein HMI54_003343 [Coelomomyces lativittatus]|nr:hypothetical protein HMI56_003598 [Coelomomyces lativittatus]KAJ1508265.1 hypothetical protein HMI54_003343 [Coelomomyces lativittatus]KAJ1515429.1 hypothetical protein HMI55_003708 [Coelomomyces lativittatus]